MDRNKVANKGYIGLPHARQSGSQALRHRMRSGDAQWLLLGHLTKARQASRGWVNPYTGKGAPPF